MSTRIRLGLFTMPPASHHSVATWKLQRNATRGLQFDRLGLWKQTAQLAEQAKFDFIFAADTSGIYSEYGDSPDAALRYALQVPCFDASVLMAALGAVTEHIGVIATHSVIGTAPYLLARKFATIDHLTGGRAGWNIVTTTHRNAAENLGLDDIPAHDERYAILDEYVEVTKKLWDSWDEDAVILDVENDTFADPTKVRAIDHVGEHFRSRGPLNIHRSPQGGPLLVSAGASPRGRRSVAQHAEAVFAINPTRAGMKAYRDDLRRIAEEEFGRDPDSIRVLHSIQPFVGETEAIAQAKLDLHNALVSPEAGVALLSGHIGIDLATRDPEALTATLSDAPGARGIATIYADGPDEDISIGQLGKYYGRNVLAPQIVGTGVQVADWIEQTIDEVGGDGFMLSPATLPSSIEDFVDLVLPELQRRGLVRADYIPGSTLRTLLTED